MVCVCVCVVSPGVEVRQRAEGVPASNLDLLSVSVLRLPHFKPNLPETMERKCSAITPVNDTCDSLLSHDLLRKVFLGKFIL